MPRPLVCVAGGGSVWSGRAVARASTLAPALAALLWTGSPGTVHAAPIGPALERPAQPTRHAAQAVLVGAAHAGARLVAVGERGIVLLSDDEGRNWRQALTPTSVTLTAVRFADEKNGYAVGHGGTVLATQDGGQTWALRLDGQKLAQSALTAAQGAGNATAIAAALRLASDGADKPLLDLLVTDARTVRVVGAYGLAFVTTDGGQTWAPWMDRLDNPKGLHLYSLRSRGPVMVIAGEQGLVLMSRDGGQSFRRVDTPYKGSFFTAEIPTDDDIVLAGLRGTAWRTRDGGRSWQALANTRSASITGSAIHKDGSVVLVNQAGQVLMTQDDALTLVSRQHLPPLNAVLSLSRGGLLALSVHGAMALPAPLASPEKTSP